MIKHTYCFISAVALRHLEIKGDVAMKRYFLTANSFFKTPSIGSIFFGTLILSFLFFNSVVYSGEVVLAWDAAPDSKAAGYKVYYGTSTKNYSKILKVGNFTSCTISGLEENKTYYFAATAYDSTDSESDFSNEVSKNITVPIFDTDGDGVSDSDEIKLYCSDPNNRDTDGDGISDGDEINVYGTDPNRTDSGGDGSNNFANEAIYRINAGGPAVTIDGLTWGADQFFRNSSGVYTKVKPIEATASDALFQSERYGSRFSYSIPVEPGIYMITLHFAEIYFSSAGARVFDIDVENSQATLVNFDIVSSVGPNCAAVKTIDNIYVKRRRSRYRF